jgi:hypothetical protein
LVCDSASSSCSRPAAACKISNGTAANVGASCRCGSVDCESSDTTGMFCVAALNQCSKSYNQIKVCSIVDGSAPIDDAPCICG